jgi:hypothetical protein
MVTGDGEAVRRARSGGSAALMAARSPAVAGNSLRLRKEAV